MTTAPDPVKTPATDSSASPAPPRDSTVTNRAMSTFVPRWNDNSPLIYQLNVRVMLSELSVVSDKQLLLEDLPDKFFKQLAAWGFDFIYLLGVWTTGQAGLAAARRFMRECHKGVPEDEVCSSPFAICAYDVDPCFGGNASLSRLRARLAGHGLGVILDFVPNHVAFDHQWCSSDAGDNLAESLIMPGNTDLLWREPQNYFLAVSEKDGSNHQVFQGDHAMEYVRNHDMNSKKFAVLAHGRDPNFDGWRDTAQLNYYSKKLRVEQTKILEKLSGMCDGVRCDMANLIHIDIMAKTWRERYHEATQKWPDHLPEFWQDAIKAVLAKSPNFKFIAEVYWNMEETLMRLGFHFCYDKDLYDGCRHANLDCIRGRLGMALDTQRKFTRFCENHDEDRAAFIYPDVRRHRGAALITYASLGMKFIHMGQLEGRIARLPVQRKRFHDDHRLLDSCWAKNVDGLDSSEIPAKAGDLYDRLIPVLGMSCVRRGRFAMAEVHASSHGSSTHQGIVAFFRVAPPPEGSQPTGLSLLVVVNYTDGWADGWVKFPGDVLSYPEHHPENPDTWLNHAGGPYSGRTVVLSDVLGSVDAYRKELNEVKNKGVWFGLQAWQAHAFKIWFR